MPAFIKPVDSSGSKGATKITDPADLDVAFDHALAYSHEELVVVEQQIVRKHYQVAGDGFIVDGRLAFHCWADEHFDRLCNGLVSIGQTFPTSHRQPWLETAQKETKRLLTLLTLLGMKTGALNFDFVFTEDRQLYFLELGPRNGGCLIPEVIRYATGVDLIKCTVDAAIGQPCDGLQVKTPKGYWSSCMVHALEDGTFKSLWLSDRIKPKIVHQEIYVTSGDAVRNYLGSNDPLGTMILRFDSVTEMLQVIDNMEHDVRVITE